MRWGGILVGVVCTACTGQSLYTTPRTAPDDASQWTLAPEAQFRTRHWKPAPGPDGAAERIPQWAPALVADYRSGVGERGEIGLHAGLADAFGVDVKWNAVRTEPFDLALMGRVVLSVAQTQKREGETRDDGAGGRVLVHLPLLLGFNAGPVTFVASPGGAVAVDAHGATLAARIGLGIQFRLAPWFALQPEATWMTDVAGPSDLGVATAGLGILFAHLPRYAAE
jgi:hypothetical protein